MASLSRPGGNITGVSYFGGGDLIAKRLGLLHELAPVASPIAVLLDPNYVEVETELQEAEAAARGVGRTVLLVKAGSERDLNSSFSTMMQAGAAGLLVGGGGFFNSQRRRLATLAARHVIFAIYNLRTNCSVPWPTREAQGAGC